MPRKKAALPGGSRASDFVSLGVLAKKLTREHVNGAVQDAGRSSMRRRELPAELVALYCVVLWLYRDVAYEDVLDCLLAGWRWLGLDGGKGATKGAITQARLRLGEKPLQLLFERVATPLAKPGADFGFYRGKRVLAVDGTTLEMPDTEENNAAFGRPSNQTGPGPFPQVRIVTLIETGTHAPVAASFGPYTTSEKELFRDLLPKLGSEVILLADRYYFSPELFRNCAATGASLLWRIKSNAPITLGQPLEDGSQLASIKTGDGSLDLRIICYQMPGSSDVIRLATNLLDPGLAPAAELASLYPQRWEAELTFDELKSHLNESRLALRSKKPELVRQEIWGLLLLHWLLRDVIYEASEVHARDPDTVSFVKAVRLVKAQLAQAGPFSP